MSLAALQAIYDALPTIECQSKCQGCCGPLIMSELEHSRLSAATLTPPSYDASTRTCSYLKHDKCNVYTLRPLLCRLWGLTELMPCPYGCQPSRMLTNDEAREIQRQVTALSGGRDVMARAV